MKNILYIFVLSFFFSCGNEKVVLLPEISHSEITEIQDVSAGYLFYNNTEKDSVELNRKNLISTTNWLINIDKRLTLKQAIPHIKYLQEKKQNSSHKNKDAKNYFTCNDTSRKNLGFIEFTDVVYLYNDKTIDISKNTDITLLNIIDKNTMIINTLSDNKKHQTNNKSVLPIIKGLLGANSKAHQIILNFNKTLIFQDYISIKSILLDLELEKVTISKEEYIY